jgi:UDP-3-O-[3-hydroxymyristoyl] glucosamine N-acyltransferase
MRSSELAKRIGALCEGEDVELRSVASFATASRQSLVFVEHPRWLDAALQSAAAAVIIPAETALATRGGNGVATNTTGEVALNAAGSVAVSGASDASIISPAAHGKTLLRARNPRLAFALAAEELRRCEPCDGGIDASAIVDPTAEVDASACIDELSVIGAAARIGPRSHIGPGCMIGPGVVIGQDCTLVARVAVYPGTTLGNRVVVQAGAVLGSDGFGFVPDPATGRYHKFPQIGRLNIGNDVEIGANTTIDRGALDATVIGDGVKLDNLVQIGHNVHIGRNTVIAAQTGISGSAILEDNVLVGGQVGIADHVRIEQGVILGAQCGVPSKKVIRGKGVVFWGTPARPITECLRELAVLARLARKK